MHAVFAQRRQHAAYADGRRLWNVHENAPVRVADAHISTAVESQILAAASGAGQEKAATAPESRPVILRSRGFSRVDGDSTA